MLSAEQNTNELVISQDIVDPDCWLFFAALPHHYQVYCFGHHINTCRVIDQTEGKGLSAGRHSPVAVFIKQIVFMLHTVIISMFFYEKK